MKYLSEYRDPALAQKVIENIKKISHTPVNLMEVCGTHTVTISKNGIRQVMPKTVTLLSGPGCPVCVTANEDIDKAIWLARQHGVILATFGDMMKVPSPYSSLSAEKAEGVDVRVVYSTLDALQIADDNPDKKVIFFGVGFETTSPTIALSILEARKRKLKNYSVLARHKLIPPAMAALLSLGEVKLHGFICPGHVSTIIGSKPYEFAAEEHGIPCVISGFEPLDVLQTIYMLVRQAENGEARVEVQYKRSVRPEGNTTALKILDEVFEVCDADWRGIGIIPNSGFKLKEEHSDFDADKIFDVDVPPPKDDPPGCSCGEILRGVKFPYQCKLFGKACTPERPIGPCMVSSEGACAAYYRYGTG
ncbi:MAG: hydrogenase formation protein HypD [Actinomycetota bacterium]|nr:hydrogenase formation protein HypD [Actinomycetota bacterium]